MSPIPVVASPTTKIWDREIIYPSPPMQAAQVLPLDRGAPNYDRNDNFPVIFSANQAEPTYGSNQGGDLFRFNNPTSASSGWPAYLQAKANAAGRGAWGLEGFRAPTYCNHLDLAAAGVDLPSYERVFWLRMWFAIVDPAMTNISPQTRVLMVPFNDATGGTPNSPNNAVGIDNTGGFGIHGNNANQWEYMSYNRAGINLGREIIPLPVHDVTKINCFEWVRVNARSGIGAYWEFYFNGALVASRNYSGVLLETTDPTNHEWAYGTMIEMNATGLAIPQSIFMRFQCRWGRFLTDGTEIVGR